METIPVQLAGTATPTLPASPLTGGANNGGDSFASTFGRALAGLADPASVASPVAPKTTSRAKSGAGADAESASITGVFLNCMVTSFVQPEPTASPASGSGEMDVTGQGPCTESSAGLLPNFASNLNASTSEGGGAGSAMDKASLLPMVGANPSTMAGATSSPGAALVAGSLPTVSLGKSISQIGAGKSEGSKPSGQLPATCEPGNQAATAGQNSMDSALGLASVGVPGGLPAMRASAVSAPTAEASVPASPSNSKSAQVSNPWSALESEVTAFRSGQSSSPYSGSEFASAHNSQAAPYFANAATQLDMADSIQLQAPTIPQSGQDLMAPSESTPSTGQTEHASSATDPQTGKSAAALGVTENDGQAEFSAMLGKFTNVGTSIKIESGERYTITPHDAVAEHVNRPQSAPRNVPVKIASEFVQTLAAPKAENPTASAAKGPLHILPGQSNAARELAGQGAAQKAVEPAEVPGASTPTPLSPSSPSSQPLNLSAQPPASINTGQNFAPQGSNGIPPGVATEANSGESGAHANLADASTSGQGKSGQQGASGGANPAIAFAPIAANSPAPDPAGNLLTAHTPNVPVSHTNTSTPPMAPSSTQQAATLSAWQNYDGGAGKMVRSAAITESAGAAEMHVELRSGPLGPLELHTVVHDGSVGAEIHVQGQEAHSLIAAGLPSLERALSDRNLRVENISVYQDHTGSGMGGGERQNSQSDSSPSPHHQALPWDSPAPPRNSSKSSLENEDSANPAAGLSVQA